MKTSTFSSAPHQHRRTTAQLQVRANSKAGARWRLLQSCFPLRTLCDLAQTVLRTGWGRLSLSRKYEKQEKEDKNEKRRKRKRGREGERRRGREKERER